MRGVEGRYKLHFLQGPNHTVQRRGLLGTNRVEDNMNCQLTSYAAAPNYNRNNDNDNNSDKSSSNNNYNN